MLIKWVKDLGVLDFGRIHWSVYENDSGGYEFVEEFSQAGVWQVRRAPALSDPITWTVQNLQAALHGG